MIQYYKNLLTNALNISTLLSKGQRSTGAQIQKIYSSPHFISLSIRLSGQTKYIYLGRGQYYEGLFLCDHNIPAHLRVRDRYLEYFRKYIRGGLLVDVEIDKLDRGICLHYLKDRKNCKFYIFWNGRNLYFANTVWGKVNKIFSNFEGYREVDEFKFSFEIFDKLGRGKIGEFTKESKEFSATEYFESVDNNLVKTDLLNKKVKFLKRKIKNITEDIHRVSYGEELVEKLNTGEITDFTGDKLLYKGIKVKFIRSESDFKKRDKVYAKAKSLKKSKIFLEDRLEKTNLELNEVLSRNINYADISSVNVITPAWPSNIEKESSLETIEGISYLKINDKCVAIGKSAKANDFIRSSWANKDDLWFHIENITGAHLIIKVNSMADISDQELGAIGSILKEYSKYEGLDIPLVYANVKEIKGIKGKAGAVTIKRPRYLLVKYDPSWEDMILTNN